MNQDKGLGGAKEPSGVYGGAMRGDSRSTGQKKGQEGLQDKTSWKMIQDKGLQEEPKVGYMEEPTEVTGAVAR